MIRNSVIASSTKTELNSKNKWKQKLEETSREVDDNENKQNPDELLEILLEELEPVLA